MISRLPTNENSVDKEMLIDKINDIIDYLNEEE